MNEMLEWFGIGLASLLGVAVLVAGWEHLAREAACALREQGAGRVPGVAQAGQVHAKPVDVSLDSLSDAVVDGNASHTVMTAALHRAAATRPPRDSSPWLDTCPQVTVGAAEPAAGAPVPAPIPSATAHTPAIEASPAASVLEAAASPAAAPAAAPVAPVIPSTAPQSTIERAALR